MSAAVPRGPVSADRESSARLASARPAGGLFSTDDLTATVYDEMFESSGAPLSHCQALFEELLRRRCPTCAAIRPRRTTPS